MDRFEELAETFDRVGAALGLVGRSPALRPFVDACGWGPRDTRDPLLPSGVRHGAPFGISFVVGAGAPELRLFVEPQADPPSPLAYFAQADRVAGFIGGEPGADLSRFEAVRALFAPTPEAPTRVWFAVALRRGAPPAYRTYLCLGGDLRQRARTLALALDRLDTGSPPVLGPDDVPTILSLDLHAAPRTKVYVLMQRHQLDHPFARALPGGHEPMGWLACHFLGAAPRVAWHYGAARHAPDDLDLAARLRRLFVDVGADGARYDRVRDAVAFRHHFISFQDIAKKPRITVYLLPEVARP